jgi:ADP-ribosyl-[dinitrogen reductase] hydrolase
VGSGGDDPRRLVRHSGHHVRGPINDTVRLVEQLRNEGREVLLHCVACQSRTPTVAALYGTRKQGISGMLALQDVISVVPDAWPNSDFLETIKRLAP